MPSCSVQRSTCKELRGLWKEKEEESLTPLLELLEGMVGGIRNKENDSDNSGEGDNEEDDRDEEDNNEDESNEDDNDEADSNDDGSDNEDEDDLCLLRDLHPKYNSFPIVRKC